MDGLAECVAPALTDPKKRLRHATLECLAVLAQCMGPSRAATLKEIVQEMNVGTMFDKKGEVSVPF